MLIDSYATSTDTYAVNIHGIAFGYTFSGENFNVSLSGNAGSDVFVLGDLGVSNADRITDFYDLVGKIGLRASIFFETHAAVHVQEFYLGASAHDGDDRIIYDPSGRLYYDPDDTRQGASSAPQVLFAIIESHALVTYQYFIII